MLDQFSWGAAGAKARHLRLRHQLSERLVEISLHIIVWNFDNDVPLASAARLDFYVQIQPLVFSRFFAFRSFWTAPDG